MPASVVTVKTFPFRKTNIPTARTKIIIDQKNLNERKYLIEFPMNHKQEFDPKGLIIDSKLNNLKMLASSI